MRKGRLKQVWKVEKVKFGWGIAGGRPEPVERGSARASGKRVARAGGKRVARAGGKGIARLVGRGYSGLVGRSMQVWSAQEEVKHG